jgi:hypothetical protein
VENNQTNKQNYTIKSNKISPVDIFNDNGCLLFWALQKKKNEKFGYTQNPFKVNVTVDGVKTQLAFKWGCDNFISSYHNHHTNFNQVVITTYGFITTSVSSKIYLKWVLCVMLFFVVGNTFFFQFTLRPKDLNYIFCIL